MKKTFYLLLAMSAFAVSCSNDDSDNNNNSSADYFPLNNGNYWVYNVPGSLETGRDSLYTANDTVINSSTYTKFKTRDLAFGFFSGALANNSVKKDGGKLLVTGSTAVTFTEDFPLDIAITDFVIFNANATANDLIGTVSGSLQQTYEGLPLTLNYTLSTTAKEDLPTYSIGGQTYTNLKRVETKLNLEIVMTYMGFPVTFLSAQDVVTSSQYYAQNIGVVYVDTAFQYNISALFADQFGVPATGSENQQEILATYSVN